MTIKQNNLTAQQVAKEIKSVKNKYRKIIDGLNERLDKANLNYAKNIVKKDINTIKAAKKVLEKK